MRVLFATLIATTGAFQSAPASVFTPARSTVRAFSSGRIIPQTPEEYAATAPMTYEEIISAAEYWGCKLEMKVLGPAYRVELRQSPWRRTEVVGGVYVNQLTGEERASLPAELAFKRTIGNPVGETDDVIMIEDRDLIGYTTGFVQPGGLLHLDTMQIRRFSGYWQRRKGYEGLDREGASKKAPSPGTYGLGLLLGGMAACFGIEGGASRAELLAILDDERQHRILVRYYQRLGFSKMRDVGDELGSLGDRLVWGGVGALMETDLTKW
eukprot:CAMPEP_0172615870 /NCGR_PEP_ID=MMETSP1068-20121228/62563_1 /TAXON_ID=35684 /ORGANISM="Pseudopedinella elastica, Strain CCMP716" /LENGTH=267 /DNA_ID=CAMNT_0013421151 /DNA_START=30 /DNA_END=830 /DNA_ORIENTATION=-